MPVAKKIKSEDKVNKAEESHNNKSENKSDVENSGNEEGSEDEEPVYYIDYILDHQKNDNVLTDNYFIFYILTFIFRATMNTLLDG
jgi:hypothetical protein